MATEERRVYLWDFFGPNAESTAKHFQKHLNGFLSQHDISDCETGVRSEQAGHFAAFCRAPIAREESLVRALRPQRALAS